MAIVRREGTFSRANKALGELLGYAPDDLQGERVMTVTHMDDLDATEAAFLLLHHGRSEDQRIEARFLHREGHTVWVRLQIIAIRDGDGELTHFLLVVYDISDRYFVAQALAESEERFRSAFEQAAMGMILSSVQGYLLRVNRSVCAILGYEESELRALDMQAVTHADDWATETPHIAQVLRGDVRSYALEKRLRHRDGRDVWVNATVSVVRDANQEPYLFITEVHDLTQERAAREERRAFEDKLRQAQKLESLGVLAGGVAHDFNNLLSGIMGHADVALLSLPPGSDAAIHVEQVLSGARKAADLSRQMLAYSGKGKFLVEFVDLGALVRDMAPLLAITVSKKLTLSLRFADELPPVEVDASQIRQVVMNVVLNASEAYGERHGEIVVSAKLVACDRAYLSSSYLDDDLPEGNYVALTVKDSGAGMSEATLARIFDPFFTTKFAGRGLGLASLLGIVRGHRGAVRVESAVGRGTSFTVLLPAAKGSERRMSTRPVTAQLWRGHGTVLVVDDEDVVRRVSKTMLERMGFTVLDAADGEEAVAIFREKSAEIRAVLLDLTMPRMDGEETFRELLQIRADVRVVLVSGFSEQAIAERLSVQQLAGFLQKPYRMEDLRQTLRAALDPPHDPARVD
jgi:two-component system, cell cycle sensor histidine kinase and response regulator CckA